jgi:ABC-type transporter Mla maintaining outer membrane lipid asymmetry permease subunit MlaE
MRRSSSSICSRRALPALLRRFGLVVAQIHAIGNRSLVIILASGMAVGFVLALQMYYALVTYGAAEAWAWWSTWRWCANWGRWSRRCCLPAVPAPR